MFGATGSNIAWLVIAVIAAWTVMMCLKVISFNIDHAVAQHKLAMEVQALWEARLSRRTIPTAEIVDLPSEPRLGLRKRETTVAQAPPGAEAGASGGAGADVREAGVAEVAEPGTELVAAAKAA